jgi:ectoine hydroxylase-related dioxygenase (phytanoyl-CoA dioxygenase family)
MDCLEAVSPGDPAAIHRFAAGYGYVWLPGLLPCTAVLALRGRVEEALARGCLDLLSLQQRFLCSPELDALRMHPRLLAAIELLTGSPVAPRQGDVLRVVWPGDTPTPPHQDACYVGAAPALFSAWIPVGNCPLESGPLAVWPRSHTLGLLPHGQDGLTGDHRSQARWNASNLACGDVLILNALTAHRALPNKTRMPRISVDCRYRAANKA